MSRRGQRRGFDENGGYDAWDRSAGQRRVNGDYAAAMSSTSMARELEDLVRTIESEWSNVTSLSYSPVETAMQLLDRSSLGRDYNAFKALYVRLERALQFVVNDHFQEFNNSIGLYRGLVQNLESSQERLRRLRDTLIYTKERMTKQGGDLSMALNRSQQYKEMIKLLETMDQLQAVPDKIETLITEKHFTRAVDILSESLKILNQPEYKNMGALQDISIYLKNQETSLHDLLVEELHNHLYLKSPYCVDRWTPYEPGQRQIPRKENVSKFVNSLEIFPSKPPITDLAVLNDISVTSKVHPESDSFSYIQQIVMALHSLSQVHRAMDTITQRLPLEVYQLVDKTIQEIELRRQIDWQNVKGNKRQSAFDAQSGGTGGFIKSEKDAEILADLMWTLYSKMTAVLSGHRVVHDCVLKIVKESKTAGGGGDKENLVDTPEFNYIEVWKPIQSEIRSLLLDYLTNDVHATTSVQSTGHSLTDLFTKRKAKDDSKVLFRLDYDQQSNRKANEEEMYKLLETSVPGLVLQRERNKAESSTIGTRIDISATGHKLLIAPDPFNIVYLLPPTISFLDRVKELIPASLVSSTVTSFLDDFLVAVFLPQLEDTVTDAFSQIANDDTFQTVSSTA